MAQRLRWQVVSGDVDAALLRPHHVLLAADDARCATFPEFSFVTLTAATDGRRPHAHTEAKIVLEVIIDPNDSDRGGLPTGVVQVHPWILETLDLATGDAVELCTPPVDADGAHRPKTLELAAVGRYPTRTTASTTLTSHLPPGHKGHASILPDCVRAGLVDGSAAATRQLGAMFHSPKAIANLVVGTLVPIQLMGETFVFRIEAAVDGDNTTETTRPLTARIVGCAENEKKDEAPRVDQLTTALSDLHLDNHDDDATGDDDKLLRRLWDQRFAGYERFIRDALFYVTLNFATSPTTIASRQLSCHGIILEGAPGVGKSSALRVLVSELDQRRIPTWRVDAMTLMMDFENSRVPSAFEYLTGQFAQFIPRYKPPQTNATDNATSPRRPQQPSATGAAGVVCIDNIDVLFQSPNGQTSDNDDDQGLAVMPLGSALLRILDGMVDPRVSSHQRLCIVGTTTSTASGGVGGEDATLPPVAKRSGRFEKFLQLIVPTEAMRGEILRCHLSEMPLSPIPAIEVGDGLQATGPTTTTSAWLLGRRLAALTGGYVAKDLVRICRSAYLRSHMRHGANDRGSGSVTWDDLVHAQRLVPPSQLRELNVASPSHEDLLDASGFAGYDELQKQLGDFIDWKFRPTEAMKHLGVGNPSGLLIHGPSGCGKSLLVKTLAGRAKVNFVSVKSSELLSKYFGDSERAVRQLFARARGASPCLLFFDEFDAIAHKRSFGDDDGGGGDGGGVYARILSTFLNEMDGVGAHKTATGSGAGEILVIAATNRFDALDAALVRPGRMDKTVEIPHPGVEDRVAILRHYTRKMPIGVDVDLLELANRPTGNRVFTGADLAAVCKEAAFRALRDDIDAERVERHHFNAAWDQRCCANPGQSPGK